MKSPVQMRLWATLVVALLASGCSNLPRPVSSLKEIEASSEQGSINLVPLTATNLPQDGNAKPSWPAAFGKTPEYDYDKIGVGDRLQVRIFESGTPTVFTTAGSSDFGQLTVDESGQLYLPFVGAVHAAGMTMPQLRSTILNRLRTVVLKPQVDIREVDARSRMITVQGDAAKTGAFPIDRGRSSLTELLAEIAPKADNPDMLAVTVRRNGASGTVRLADIYQYPALDISLRPGDSVLLHELVENVTVLGAAGLQGQVRIPKRDFTLLDAIGQARGLSPEAADPRAVFVMRQQPGSSGPPLVYQVNFRQPEAIALAGRFDLRDGDAVLISSAPWAQSRQVIAAFSQGMASLRSAATIPLP
ncbi:polysaccharide biosynthesis/export protein [Sphingomonas sp. F9_3S_D5_B_2]